MLNDLLVLGKMVPTRLLDDLFFAFARFSSFNSLSLINKSTSLTILLNIHNSITHAYVCLYIRQPSTLITHLVDYTHN